jgi:PAS domain S-box-containing protein
VTGTKTDPFVDPALRSALLASVVDTSEDAIVCSTLDGIVATWNAGAEHVYGYRADEMLGQPVAVLTPSGRPGEIREIIERIRNGERVHTYERTRRTKMGDLIRVSMTVSPILDADGVIIGASSIARDISEKNEAEEQLQIASEYARSLIEASRDPLVMISPEGKITDVNEATIRATGVDRDGLVGTDFSDYFTEPDKAREGYREVFAEGFVTDYPLTISHTSGTFTHVLYNSSVYKDAAGNVLGIFAAARDVTAQRQAETEVAKQRGRELERLAELERFQRLTVGRELRMVELKMEIEELRRTPDGNVS